MKTFKCPECGTEFQMLGENDTLECKACGAKARMNDYYDSLLGMIDST